MREDRDDRERVLREKMRDIVSVGEMVMTNQAKRIRDQAKRIRELRENCEENRR